MVTTAFRVGSLGQDAVTGIKCLYSFPASSYYDCVKIASVNYQVTAGKTLYITKLMLTVSVTASYLIIGYGDNAIDNAVTVPTNWKVMTSRLPLVLADQIQSFDVFIPIPATKYAHVYTSAGGSATIFGIEL